MCIYTKNIFQIMMVMKMYMIFKIITLAILFLVVEYNNVNAQWENIGPYGGYIHNTAINQKTGELYSCTLDGGFFKSTNQGEDWSLVNFELGKITSSEIRSLVVVDDNILAGSTGAGVLLSSDNGLTWNPANFGLPLAITTLVVSGKNVFAGTFCSGVFMSTNGGWNWISKNNGIPPKCISEIAICDSNLVIGTDDGIYLSTNMGDNWQLIKEEKNSYNTQSIAIKGDTIYASVQYGGFFISTNKGLEWKISNEGLNDKLPVGKITIAGTKIFITNGGSLFQSTDNGINWSKLNGDLFVASILFNDGILYVGTNNGIYKSDDFGITWKTINNGLSNLKVVSIYTEKENLIVGTYGNGLFSSADKGGSWNEIKNEIDVNYIYSSFATNYNDIFVGTDGKGILYSSNYGNSWELKNNGLKSFSITAIFTNGKYLFASSGGNLYRSYDNGKEWRLMMYKDLKLSVTSFLETDSSLHKRTIFASTWNGVYLSTDLGESWIPKNKGLNEYSVLSLARIDSNLFASTLENGIFLSTNKGENWFAIDKGLNNKKSRRVNCIAAVGKNLFIGTKDGLYFSSNNGSSWSSLPIESANPFIKSLTISDNYIHVCTYGSSVFRAKLSDIITSVEDNGSNEITKINLFPNPANEYLNISFESTKEGTGKIEIIDLFGKTVCSFENFIIEGNNSIKYSELSTLPTTTYTIKVTMNNEIVSIGKFIKQ